MALRNFVAQVEEQGAAFQAGRDEPWLEHR
jgi:hypothetical protein